jgi:hypothetical protein
MNLGLLGYTKTVAAEVEGVNAAEYLTEVIESQNQVAQAYD